MLSSNTYNSDGTYYPAKSIKSLSQEILGSKVPPHSSEAEEAVLGAMLLERNAIAKAIELLEPDSFYSQVHKTLFETIISMFERSIEVDVITLSEELLRKNSLDFIGGPFYIAEINSKVPTAANVEHYARIVLEKNLKRQLITTAGKILANAYDDTTDALDEVDRAEAEIFKIAEKRFHRGYVEVKKLAHDTMDLITHLIERDKKGVTGVPSGFVDLDSKLGGFQKSDFIIVAARPSMGKTALGLSIVRNIAVEYQIPVAFFSVEMSAIQLMIRLLAAEARVNSNDIRTGNISQANFAKIAKTIDKIAYAPIIIDDSPSLSIMELRAKCRRLKAEHQIQLVMVDYLQLMSAVKAESREREISVISQSLKQLAKELDIPVVAMAQLNRSVEGRPDKRPMLSDLRESGSIEQDADVVIFINRPEYYKIAQYDDGSPTAGTAEIIIGKQRNGPIGTIRLAYLQDYTRFENLEMHYGNLPEDMSARNNDGPDYDDAAPF